jgi:hypothetical protein
MSKSCSQRTSFVASFHHHAYRIPQRRDCQPINSSLEQAIQKFTETSLSNFKTYKRGQFTLESKSDQSQSSLQEQSSTVQSLSEKGSDSKEWIEWRANRRCNCILTGGTKRSTCATAPFWPEGQPLLCRQKHSRDEGR